MGYVYLLGDSEKEGFYKIGVTKNSIEKRIKKLQTGNCGEIYLINYYKTDYPYYVEGRLHAKFFKEKKLGEWFELDYDDVVKFTEHCEKITELIKSLSENPFFMKNLK